MSRIIPMAALWILGQGLALAADSNSVATPLPVMSPALPDAGISILRVLGGLIFVVALFLGGAYVFRNLQRQGFQRGATPRLKIVETRSLGNRHALYVVGYDERRLLVAVSPNEVRLLSELPNAAADDKETVAPQSTFSQTLNQLLGRKS